MYEPVLTLAERLAVVQARREADIMASASAALPTQDAMFHPKDWPAEARVWLYKAGINNDDIALMGAFWSPRMGRVVVPYTTLSGESAWIARDVGLRDGPKYLFPAGVSRGGGALFKRGVWSYATGIVVVEDALSAYRIAKDTELVAVAAQGTSLDRGALVSLVEISDTLRIPIITWLDPDKYGQMGAARIRGALGNLGVEEVRNIVSERDPKFHEPAEIREALET